MSEQKKKPTFWAIMLSLFGFVLLWAVLTDAWGYSAHLTIKYGSYIQAYLSRLIWVAPAVWLILRHDSFLRFSKGKLFSRPVWDKPFIIVTAGSFLYALGTMLEIHGGVWLNRSVNLPLEIIKLAMVGFVEEIVFRGWGYNALSEVTTERKAVACSAALFVLLHSPAYLIRLYRLGTMDFSAWLMQSLAAAIWGVVCCRLLKKSGTILNPIIAHTVYDILITLFVG